tara:strand:+ start:209 stop:919 length:711 start_codon:yes stop_codon:yes gene_type:complete
MATALDIIRRSMRLVHILDAEEEPTGAEAQDGLTTMNDLIDSWSLDHSYVYTVRTDTLTWTANNESRTIGASGNFVTTRPVKIHPSTYYTDVNGNDYQFTQIATRAGYTSIVDKGTTSTLPQYMYYEPSFPNGTIYIWPVPDASITIQLSSREQLSSLALLTTAVSFPPGYKQAFVTSLAEEIAAEFGVAVPPEVGKSAFKARTKVRRANRRTPISQVEAGLINSSRSFNIYTGGQ